jgi:putative ABC transport system substrate-binding protein
VSLYANELNQKRLEILKEAMSGVRQIGVLWNANNPAQNEYWLDTRSAADRIGLTARPMTAKGLGELEASFAGTKGERLDGLVVLTDAEFDAGREKIIRLAAEYGLPAIYEHRAFVEAGGLISYGPSIDQLSYRAAAYVDKILKGMKPADLPIEQPTRFELIVNLKTAKTLGITIPPSFLLRADEVIE